MLNLTKVFTIIIVLSTYVHAVSDIPSIEISNFNAQYSAPSGVASSEKFFYNSEDYGNNMSVELQAGELILTGDHHDITLSNLPEQVKNWKNLTVQRVDLTTNQRSIELLSERIDYTNGEDEQGYITGVDLKCNTISKSLVNSIADMCLNQKMSLYIPYIKGVSINNINFWATNNKMNFSIKNKVWIKGYGAIFFDETKQMVRIRIDKAKTGFINVTGKVFSELKGMENDFIKVNRPWVEITLPTQD